MNKRNFYKQVKRAENMHREELEEMLKDEWKGYTIGEYWKEHMKGHVYITEILINLCNKGKSMEEIKHYIKKQKRAVTNVLRNIEKLYDIDDMPELVEKEYHFNHGIECFLIYMGEIIRGKKYISKAYEDK